MTYSLWDYFIDPIFQAPMVGSILMCLGASLMGVLVFVRKKSLLAESLSHAAYPGVVLGAVLFHLFFPHLEEWSFLAALGGAFLSSFLGVWVMNRMIFVLKVPTDSALSFVLSSFFGMGVLFASGIQVPLARVYKEIQFYLFGQMATMTDVHVLIYACLGIAIVLFLYLFFRQLQTIFFHFPLAESLGIKAKLFDQLFFILLVLSIVIGIRSVGIVLMSAMLIAPAVSARQFTDRLSSMLWLSSLFGCFFAFLGNVLSIELSLWLNAHHPEKSFSLPTGPVIALVGSSFAFLSLLFSPKRGLFSRMVRITRFKCRCLEENVLKSLWKKEKMTFSDIQRSHPLFVVFLSYFLMKMTRQGWIYREEKKYRLTKDGFQKAKKIIRLHRLWELYLAGQVGIGVEKVHRNAEEMEHIITPELEERLTHQLSHPTMDPHAQPIPEKAILGRIE